MTGTKSPRSFAQNHAKSSEQYLHGKDPELLYKVAITQIPMVGAVTARTLISYCGGVEAVFRAKKKELCKIPGVGDLVADYVINQDVLGHAEQELEFMEQHGI
ncbi:MAG TPA: helix-hairpin-helix domain-containing protein, partial [Saprospiraceae bacterium]|nr:helix-hairpin-helix domain-containing protein [Saprospiraceae bacterium]